MAKKPSIPMSPQDLPQQRLTLVPSFPQLPAGVETSTDEAFPGLPARRPHSARYVAQVEWSWSPVHGRIEAHHLSLNAARNRWVLWVSFFDQDSWRFGEAAIAAHMPRAGLDETAAAALLLQAYWTDQASGWEELDAFHWINEEGLLDTGMLSEIERRVWDEHEEDEDDGDDEEVEESDGNLREPATEQIGAPVYRSYLKPHELAAYYREQRQKPDAGISASAMRAMKDGKSVTVRVVSEGSSPHATEAAPESADAGGDNSEDGAG